MTRIFQHYEGDIPEFKGMSFCEVTALTENDDVILIWLTSQDKRNFYRIFIDGYYCGVDCYSNSLISDDVDEDIQLTPYNVFFNQKLVTKANVTLDGGYIQLCMNFTDNSQFFLIGKVESGECHIQLVD